MLGAELRSDLQSVSRFRLVASTFPSDFDDELHNGLGFQFPLAADGLRRFGDVHVVDRLAKTPTSEVNADLAPLDSDVNINYKVLKTTHLSLTFAAYTHFYQPQHSFNTHTHPTPPSTYTKMPKERRSLQSFIVPSFLHTPPHNPNGNSSSVDPSNNCSVDRKPRARAFSEGLHPYFLTVAGEHASLSVFQDGGRVSPSAFLHSDDPFANLSSPTPAPLPARVAALRPPRPTTNDLNTSLNNVNSTPLLTSPTNTALSSSSPRSPLSPSDAPSASTISIPTTTNITTALPTSASPVVSRPTLYNSVSTGALRKGLRPAHTRPAFQSRPSLPSLRVLENESVVVKRRARYGSPGAKLPYEPWNSDVSNPSPNFSPDDWDNQNDYVDEDGDDDVSSVESDATVRPSSANAIVSNVDDAEERGRTRSTSNVPFPSGDDFTRYGFGAGDNQAEPEGEEDDSGESRFTSFLVLDGDDEVEQSLSALRTARLSGESGSGLTTPALSWSSSNNSACASGASSCLSSPDANTVEFVHLGRGEEEGDAEDRSRSFPPVHDSDEDDSSAAQTTTGFAQDSARAAFSSDLESYSDPQATHGDASPPSTRSRVESIPSDHCLPSSSHSPLLLASNADSCSGSLSHGLQHVAAEEPSNAPGALSTYTACFSGSDGSPTTSRFSSCSSESSPISYSPSSPGYPIFNSALSSGSRSRASFPPPGSHTPTCTPSLSLSSDAMPRVYSNIDSDLITEISTGATEFYDFEDEEGSEKAASSTGTVRQTKLEVVSARRESKGLPGGWPGERESTYGYAGERGGRNERARARARARDDGPPPVPVKDRSSLSYASTASAHTPRSAESTSTATPTRVSAVVARMDASGPVVSERAATMSTSTPATLSRASAAAAAESTGHSSAYGEAAPTKSAGFDGRASTGSTSPAVSPLDAARSSRAESVSPPPIPPRSGRRPSRDVGHNGVVKDRDDRRNMPADASTSTSTSASSPVVDTQGESSRSMSVSTPMTSSSGLGGRGRSGSGNSIGEGKVNGRGGYANGLGGRARYYGEVRDDPLVSPPLSPRDEQPSFMNGNGIGNGNGNGVGVRDGETGRVSYNSVKTNVAAGGGHKRNGSGFTGLWFYAEGVETGEARDGEDRGGGGGRSGKMNGGGSEGLGSRSGGGGGGNGRSGAGGSRGDDLSGGGRDGDDEGRRPPYNGGSSFSDSDSESSVSDYSEEETEERETENSADDDVPLAQRIPGALKVQRTIRRQVKDERMRRRERQREREKGKGEAILKPQKSWVDQPGFASPQNAGETPMRGRDSARPVRNDKVQPSPADYSIFSRPPTGSAKPAAVPVTGARLRTKTLPGNMGSPFSVDELTKKLLTVKASSPPVSTSIVPPSLRDGNGHVEHHSLDVIMGPMGPDGQRHGPAVGLRRMGSTRKPQDVAAAAAPIPSGAANLGRSGTAITSHASKVSRGTDDAKGVLGPIRNFLEKRRPSLDQERERYPNRPHGSSEDRGRVAPAGRASSRPSMEPARARSVSRPRQPPPSDVPPPPVPPVLRDTRTQVQQQRVFIGDLQRFHTVEIESTTSAEDVVDMVASSGALDDWAGSGGWMLWEVAQDFGMDRPIRSFELLSDIFASWNKDKMVNTLMIKRTIYEPLLKRSAMPSSSPTHRGYVEWESKRGKWNKRWMELREHSLYLAKRDNGKDETFLCSLSNFDAYHVTRLHKAPKAFTFAIKSTDNLTFFENTADYVHIFSCGEKEGQIWMEKILLARSYVLFQERNVLMAKSVGMNGPNAGGAKTLARAGTRKQPTRPGQPSVPVPGTAVFEPGSLLAKR